MASLLTSEVPEELKPFEARLSQRFYDVREKVIAFIQEDIIPATKTYKAQHAELLKTVDHPVNCPTPPVVKDLRELAKKRGLYNFFLPEVGQISVLEYAPIAELLGVYPLANAAMNCSAPDTGNMEVLAKYGTAAQKEEWLEPLLSGEIRSAFAMTEPGVASSDATNISTRFDYDKATDEYVINGHKWYISGACRPECQVLITMGKTRFDGPIHQRQSMIIVPRHAPGVKILRPLAVFGHEHDHAEIIFDNVRVPASNMILGEGKGFEIAQGRLGPGRIHHCMRTVGSAEAALAALIYRANNRTAFGKLLSKKDTIRQIIAEARIEITKTRLLCYLAATIADEKGFKAAKGHIAMIKVAAPRMALKIIDEAIQVHGAHGVSQDSKLSDMYTHIRTLRVADGPDIVHLNTIVKQELSNTPLAIGEQISGINKNIARYGKFEYLKENQGKTQAKL